MPKIRCLSSIRRAPTGRPSYPPARRLYGGHGRNPQVVFDLKPHDIYWCAADPGWITGHSYIVYAPLVLGITNFMYEGAPTYPNPDRWWSMIEICGISILYTAPTAIRGLMRFGELAELTTCPRCASWVPSGEPINRKPGVGIIGSSATDDPVWTHGGERRQNVLRSRRFRPLPLKPGSGNQAFPRVKG